MVRGLEDGILAFEERTEPINVSSLKGLCNWEAASRPYASGRRGSTGQKQVQLSLRSLQGILNFTQVRFPLLRMPDRKGRTGEHTIYAGTHLEIHHELKKTPLGISQQHSWLLDTEHSLSFREEIVDNYYRYQCWQYARRTIPQFASLMQPTDILFSQSDSL